MARRNSAANIALGGVLASLAVAITWLGGLIPATTFVCPMLSMLILAVVLKRCGARIAWAWYGAVAILGCLLSPDKEAAAVFAFLGYYPILKPKMDTLQMRWLWKTLLFNAAILLMYWLLMHIFGMAQILSEFEEMGTVLTLVTLLMGNVTFFLLDRLLSIRFKV
ncbi:MAG: hypothetical protein IJZ15_01095 [Oscillospiraceae bacterium]|nr:hypothetical protein [Oscillospiraceae bacterium]